MTRFKDLLQSALHFSHLPDAQVSAQLEGQKLHLKFDQKDVIQEATYEGVPDIWLSSLCSLINGMTLAEARLLDFSAWELAWKDDQLFWDLQQEISDKIFFPPLEMLHLALDIYQGREFLYQDESPLICRCFGVRTSDIVACVDSGKGQTLEAIGTVTKAGMGCRTCVPQIKELLPTEKKQKVINEDAIICRCNKVAEKDLVSFFQKNPKGTLAELSKATKAGTSCGSCVPELKQWVPVPVKTSSPRIFKLRPVADWVEEIDAALQRFPKVHEWNMHVGEMKGNTVIISFERKSSQREEEETGRELQGFLALAVDSDLVFFLRRAAQR